MSLPIQFRFGNTFLDQDNLLPGEPVWDRGDKKYHRIGVGSGERGPRWYPGVDKFGNMRMNYGTMLRFAYFGYKKDNEIGFDGTGNFVVRVDGQDIIRAGKLGVQYAGVLTQFNSSSQFLASNSGLSELLFPLFSDKVLTAQFNRPAFAAVDRNNKFKAYRDTVNFLFDFNSTFIRTQVGKPLYVHQNVAYAPAEVNEPRIVYHPISGKCRGLQIEPGSSNLLLSSYALDTWTVTGLALAKENPAGWSNKGLNPPITFSENTTNQEHSFVKTFSADITKPLALSCFVSVKAFTGSRKFTIFASNADRSQLFGYDFTFTTGTPPVAQATRLAGNGVVSAPIIEKLGNGLYRIRLTGTINPSGSSSLSTLSLTLASLGSDSTNTALSFAAAAGIGYWCYINDFQVEQRNSVTSYMPTAAVVAVRGPDILTLDLSKFQFLPDEGLIEIKFKPSSSMSAGNVIFSLQNSDGSIRLDYYLATINADTSWTVGVKTYVNNALTTTNASLQSVSSVVADLLINYTGLPDTVTKMIINGNNGFHGMLYLISYE